MVRNHVQHIIRRKRRKLCCCFFICSTTWKFITYLYLSPHQTKDHTFCQYLLWNIAIHNLYYRLVCARDNGRKRERTRTFASAHEFIFIFQSFTYLMGIIRNHLLYHIERWCQWYMRELMSNFIVIFVNKFCDMKPSIWTFNGGLKKINGMKLESE